MKKRIIFVLTAAMLFFSQVMISSCSKEENGEPSKQNNSGKNNGTNNNQQTVKEDSKYTVSYSSDFGVLPQNLTVKEGDKLTSGDLKPLDTDGYIFLGWYNGSNHVEEGFVVKQDLMLVAKWTQGSSKKDGEINGSPDDIDNPDEVPTDIVGEDKAQTDEENQGSQKKDGEINGSPDDIDNQDEVPTDIVGEDNAQTVGEYQNTPKEGEDETYPNAGDYIDNAQTDVNNN